MPGLTISVAMSSKAPAWPRSRRPNPSPAARSRAARIVIPAHRYRAARKQRTRRRQAGPPQSKHGHALSFESLNRYHRVPFKCCPSAIRSCRTFPAPCPFSGSKISRGDRRRRAGAEPLRRDAATMPPDRPARHGVIRRRGGGGTTTTRHRVRAAGALRRINAAGSHRSDQRTFSVARPIIARISEMIQKRITICGSAQPFFS